MPLLFRILGYGGNGVLLLFAVIGLLHGNEIAVILGALGGLNLYLIYRLDRLSSAESLLAGEIRMARMRKELAAIYEAPEPREAGDKPPLQLPRSRPELRPGAAPAPPR